MQKLLETLKQISHKIEELKDQYGISLGEKEIPGFSNEKLLSEEDKLTEYINKVFEQQERERIVRWIVDSIRESLDLDEVLHTTVEEVSKLLKVDRCLIALFNKETLKFDSKSEYRLNEQIPSIINYELAINKSRVWYKKIIIDNAPVIVNNVDLEQLTRHQKELYKLYNTKSAIIMPIIHKKEVLGIFSVHQVQNPRTWNESHIEILKDIGSQIAIAIRQAELYSTTKRQADREKFLRKIISTIRSTFDIDEILKTMCEEVTKIFDVERTVIVEYPCDNDYQSWITRREYTVDDTVKISSNIDFDRRFGEYWRENLIQGNTVGINNVYEYDAPVFFKETYELIGGKSVLASPIKKGDKVWGSVVLVKVNEFRHWSEDEKSLIETIADQVYLAIQQAELFSTTKKQAEREKSLRTGITTIRSSLDIDVVLSNICNEIARIFKVQRVAIGDFRGEIRNNAILAEYRSDVTLKGLIDDLYFDKTRKFWIKALNKAGTSLAFDDINESDVPDYFKRTYELIGIKSIIGIPIKKGEEIWGGLFLSEYSNYRHWTDDETDLLMAIADQVSIAISQASLYTQTQEATRLKSEFLANMSHEFRTPLNAIIGFSEMLSSGYYGELTTKQGQYLNNIAISGKHLLRLVNDILDLSKVESGNMRLHYETLNTGEIIEESISILRDMAEQKNINIELQLTDININVDALRFRQIMYNLLSNAIKFTMNDGKVNVRTRVENDTIRVEVEDTGIGISKENRDKIFTQFRQLDSSYARKQEGTGLGLVLTKKLVELHKGSIDFESAEGKGSIFWFTLPLEGNN